MFDKFNPAEVVIERNAKEVRSFPKLRSGFSAMVPNINRASLFPPLSNAKETGPIDCVYPVVSFNSEDKVQGSIRYIGARLTQFHKRVLLGLVERVAGKEGDQWVSFHAADFLESIGKEGDSRNINRLYNALTELRSATFCVREHAKDKGVVFGWLNEAEFAEGSRQVRVLVSGKAAQRFGNLGQTYLQTQKRNKLDDGMQTWLYDFIRSSETPKGQPRSFGYDALAALLGRKSDADFGKAVRSALVKLVEVDAIEQPTFRRGRFSVIERPLC